MAIAAVDCALWDLKARLLDLPDVLIPKNRYQLLRSLRVNAYGFQYL
jgi:hypothetical protein